MNQRAGALDLLSTRAVCLNVVSNSSQEGQRPANGLVVNNVGFSSSVIASRCSGSAPFQRRSLLTLGEPL